MTKRLFILAHPEARSRACQAVAEAPDGHAVAITPPKRTLEQNAAQWPILEAFAKQKQAVINGRLEWVEAEDWKDILTAAFNDELGRVALGLDGRMVLLGQRTSKFDKQRFSEWLEFLNAAAVAHGVLVWEEEAHA